MKILGYNISLEFLVSSSLALAVSVGAASYLVSETLSGESQQVAEGDPRALRAGEQGDRPDRRSPQGELGFHGLQLEPAPGDHGEELRPGHRWDWRGRRGEGSRCPSGDEGCAASRAAQRSDLESLPPSQRARARTLTAVLSELIRRSSAAQSSASTQESVDEEPPEEYAAIRQYLVENDEVPDELPRVIDILGEPSNIVDENGVISLVKWGVRDREPRGSYLYIVTQDMESRITQVHRYFCPERRLDILAETCVPIASVYSSEGTPIAVDYGADGSPIEWQAEDLDRSQFSRADASIEANEFLLHLQDYFEALRTPS